MKIAQRYESICKRDFKYRIELYLFNMYLNNSSLDKASVDGFSNFESSKDIIDNYQRACQLSSKDSLKSAYSNDDINIDNIDNKIEEWLADKDRLKLYSNKHKEIFSAELPQKVFEDFYSLNEKKCGYCGITENEIITLINKGEIKTKRLLTRGRTLEIDRKEPDKFYSTDNIILCCYWCNNAKTDEFSYDEFNDYIAPGIKKIWGNRLK